MSSQNSLSKVIIVMGVAGSGKTAIGERLARDTGWSFRDADDFHPKENVAKMRSGTPLTDADRAPWLAKIRAHIDGHLARGENTIVSCSALKRAYRGVLSADVERVKFVHLHGDFLVILERIRGREGHFMKENMLRSQFETLEPPLSDEALRLDVTQSPEAIVAAIRREFAI